MITQQTLRRAASALPETFSYDELFEKIQFIEELEKGLKSLDEGNFVSHEDMLKMVEQWQLQ